MKYENQLVLFKHFLLNNDNSINKKINASILYIFSKILSKYMIIFLDLRG